MTKEIYQPTDIKIAHVARAPFYSFSRGGDSDVRGQQTMPIEVGKGGIEVAVAIGGRQMPDVAFTLSANGLASNDHRWTTFSFDKRHVPELGVGDHAVPISHTIFEQEVSQDLYRGFRNWSIVMWWIHHGLADQLKTDVEEFGFDKGLNFVPSHTAHRMISKNVAEQINSLPQDVNTIVVQDVYYHPRVATILRERFGNKSRIIGVNHIPFPDVSDFELMKHISPSHWDKLVGAYLNGWLSFDTISFHTEEDAKNFVNSVKRYYKGNRALPELIVNPLGIDIEMVEKTSNSVSETDRKRLSGLVSGKTEYLQSADDLKGLIIGASIGYRSDPIKQIPFNLEAMDYLLKVRPDLVGKFTYIQQMRPHRIDDFPSYREEYQRIKELVKTINNKQAFKGWQPIILIDQEIRHQDVIRLQRVLADTASKYFTSIPSIEGMNLAGQETFVASGRPDVGLITTIGSGLGRTLIKNGAGEFVIPDKKPKAADMANAIDLFLSMSNEEISHINRKVREVLESMHPAYWLDRLLRSADNSSNMQTISLAPTSESN